MIPQSLRTRLLLGTTLTMVLVLGLLGFAVDASIRRTLTAEFDNALLSKAQALASFVEQHDQEIRFEFDAQRMPEFAPGPHPAYFEVWLEGKRTDTSPSLPKDQSLSHADLPARQTGFARILLPNGHLGRLVAFPFSAYADDDEAQHPRASRGILYAAVETAELDRTLASLRFTIAALCLAAIAVCGAALLAVVNRARPPPPHRRQKDRSPLRDRPLRPHPRRRPPLRTPPHDRSPQRSPRSPRVRLHPRTRPTADVAHELRTPIAGLRTTLEVCRSRPRDPVVYTAAIDRSLKVIHSMQTVIENLLLLARAESGQLPLNLADTDLPEFIRDAWSTFAPRAAELTVRFNLPDTCVLPIDAPKLRVVLTNLFDNAISYTSPAGTIDIDLLPTPTHTELRVSNTVEKSDQLAAHELPRLFERFWRKDSARSQTGLHAGLGLSLCQRLLALSNATITPTIDSDRFTITLLLPQPTAISIQPTQPQGTRSVSARPIHLPITLHSPRAGGQNTSQKKKAQDPIPGPSFF